MATARNETNGAAAAIRARVDVKAVLDLVGTSAAITTEEEAERLVARLAETPGIRSARLSTGGRPPAQGHDRLGWQIGKPPRQRTLHVRTTAPSPDLALTTALDAFARVLAEKSAERTRSPAGLAPQLLRAVVENARAVIVLVWPDGSLSSISQSFSVVLGYDNGTELPRGFLDLVHRDDRANAIRLFKAAFAHHPVEQPVDLRLRTASGDWVVLETRIRGLLDDVPVGAVVLYGLDVTGRRRIEQGLHGEQQRLAQVIQTLQAGVVLVDQKLNVVVVNRSFAAMFYLADDPDSLAGRPLGHVLGGLGEILPDPAQITQQVEEARYGRSVTGQEHALLDGRVVELDIVPVGRSDDGLGTLLYLRDVTERAAVRTGLERRNRTLTEAAALNSTFIASISHELRGPLTSVAIFADFLTDATQGELSDEYRQFAEVIKRNSNRLLAVIEELGLISRLESGGLPLHVTSVSVPDLVRTAVEEHQPSAELAEVALRAEIEDGPVVRCDEVRLREVLANLLVNSLKFTPAGGAVLVRAAPTPTGWEIEVADTGIGVPKDELSQLFTPFYRNSTVGPGGPPGPGLGLAIGRAIIERHGGTIRASSTQGEGTTITIWLPQRRTDDRDDRP